MARTQILITDVPKARFDEQWPQLLRREMAISFPDVEPEYFTPLSFLNRVVIIFRGEEDTARVYEWLRERCAREHYKVYLSEPLVGKPRGRSLTAVSPQAGDGAEEAEVERPLLQIDTASAADSAAGGLFPPSPSLSPDKQISPTKIKFPDDPKVHYYMEPAPERHTPVPERGTGVPSDPSGTQFLYRGRSLSPRDNMPLSPSITLNRFPSERGGRRAHAGQ
ncbi:ACR105Wp [Eremothecium gossypii ATCC 10895]|uniref:ACR105Wp n=1 Tax=Eremothecium gossypii (strain ATCC 10895 / CBS 109.51 / FGSC 9923 / NRRL Y-1056) TaxID=284811 RepID=Q75C12_EREGS|nr:ACR105Wp [Eremothecium gossypii ATCC 10895]AAS51331.1 ACR105Wp [Eremothecium gossypii ATCC 10895]AEY95623.1 FACR105Wp [Eremothecium gossypii FDAG1]